MGMKMYKKQGVPQVASFVLVAGLRVYLSTGATTSKPCTMHSSINQIIIFVYKSGQFLYTSITIIVKIFIEGTGIQLETKLRTVLYTQIGILLIYGLSGNSYLWPVKDINIHCNYQLFPTRESFELNCAFHAVYV